MLSMVNSAQQSSSNATNDSSDAGNNMTGASVAQAIASLASSGSADNYAARQKFAAMQPQPFPMGDRRDNFDPAFTQARLTGAAPPNATRVTAAPKKRSTKSKCSPGLRSGKWTPEEEAYTNTLIHFFKRGLLDVEDGTSLRWYLAQRLNCEAMRVTKKLKGNSSIGKQIFRAIENSPANRQAIRRAREELAVVEARFLESLSNGNITGNMPLPTPSSLAVSVRGRKILPNPKGKDGQPVLAPMPSDQDPPAKPEDAKLLIHFFAEAHDEPESETETKEGESPKKEEKGSLSVDLSEKLGKKRPLSSISSPVKKHEESKPEEDAEAPQAKRQNAESEDRAD